MTFLFFIGDPGLFPPIFASTRRAHTALKHPSNTGFMVTKEHRIYSDCVPLPGVELGCTETGHGRIPPQHQIDPSVVSSVDESRWHSCSDRSADLTENEALIHHIKHLQRVKERKCNHS